MVEPPSFQKETRTRTGRRLWAVTLSIAGALILIGTILLLVAKHIGFPK
jgi:hypothetical protein